MTLVEKIIYEAFDQQAYEDLEALIQKYEAKGCDVNLHFRKFDSMQLSTLKVGETNNGTGTAFMQEMCAMADHYGITITLTASADYGSNLNRLVKFYKRFGFTMNKGSNKDFRFMDSMIRTPK